MPKKSSSGQSGINMVDLMMWLVIAALLLATALQSIGYYQKAAYLNNMKHVAQVAGTNAFAVSAQDDGTINTAVINTAATDTTWSQGMEYTVEESSVVGGSPYLRVTNASVTDQDVIYLFESCGDTYTEGVNVVPKDGTPQLESCGVTPATEEGGAGDAGGTPAPTSAKMTTVWDTRIVPEWEDWDGHADCTFIRIPLSGTIDATIDWGDGKVERVTTPYPSHQYSGEPGVKTVTIDGTFTGWVDGWAENLDWTSFCLTGVPEWGETGTTGATYGFQYASNLTELDRVPSTVTDYSNLLDYATSFNDDITDWDTSRVTSTSYMFHDATVFNHDLSAWNKSNITDMSGMFSTGAFMPPLTYSHDVTNWDMSNVQSISAMFRNNENFNQDISRWNVSNVTEMRYFFSGVDSFNRDLSNWNVSNVTDMSGLLSYANYAGDLSKWNTTKVQDMSWLMQAAAYVNPSVSSWKTPSVTNLNNAFSHVTGTPDLSGWDTSKVTDMSYTFAYQKGLPNGISGWNTSSVTNMSGLFTGTPFIGDISNWNTSNVQNMSYLFTNSTATAYPDLSKLNVSKVNNFSWAFGNTKFNQNISSWKPSSAVDMSMMFYEATAFNQNISSWVTAYPSGTYPSAFSSSSALTKANHPLAFQSSPSLTTGKWK